MTQVSNPLLAKLRTLDGFTIRLPSRGQLYEEGVLREGVVDGEIRVYAMTTRDEILLRSADGLFGGTTIDQVFARCVPDVLKPRELFFSDLDFILVALRQCSYGEEMTIEYEHDCPNAKNHSYNVSVTKLLRNSKELDPLELDEKFTLTLNIGRETQEVKLRPIRMQSMMQILQPPTQEELTSEQAEDEMLKMYIAQIHSVDGETDVNLIHEWMASLPTLFVKQIREKIASVGDWGVSYNQDIVCRDCGEVVTISTPINPVAFFS